MGARDKIKKNIGLRIKNLREKKFGKIRGSQKKCADAIGVTPGYWSNIEKGRKLLGLDKIESIADFFECDPEYIMAGEDAFSADESDFTESQKAIISLGKKMMLEGLDLLHEGEDFVRKAIEDPEYAEQLIASGIENIENQKRKKA